MYDKEPEMTIERNGEQIQLTEKELRKAYYTYQTILDREDIVMGLEIAKERGSLSVEEIDVPIFENILLKKYDISNNEEVITDLISEYRYVLDENAFEWERYRFATIERLVSHLEHIDATIKKSITVKLITAEARNSLLQGKRALTP